jgi:GNAT superfamily N-acetyltransferase
MNPHTFDAGRLILPGGRSVHIRELRPGEDAAVRRLFARLSPRTRYLRFHSPATILTESLLRMLADVDDSRRLTLVAELDECNSGDVVALGNVVAGDDDRAEMGLVVADAWQRQRVGVALAIRLMRAAEARGYDRFVVHELWDNRALRPLLRRVADIVSINTRFGASEITFVRRRSAAEQAYDRILAAKGGLSRIAQRLTTQ